MQLQIRPAPAINWLRYGISITANAVNREYSVTPMNSGTGTGTGAKNAANTKPNEGVLEKLTSATSSFSTQLPDEVGNYALSTFDEQLTKAKYKVTEDISQLLATRKSVEADWHLMELLTTTYRQTTWPTFTADQQQRADTAKVAYGEDNAPRLAAREVLDAPQEWPDKLGEQLNQLVQDTTRLHKLVDDNDNFLRKRAALTGNRLNPTQHTAHNHRLLLGTVMQLATKEYKAAMVTKNRLEKQLQNTALQKEREVLSDVFVQLRDAQAPDLPDAIVIPRDKDEVNIELKLVTLPSYKYPPGQTPRSTERTVKTTLFVAPRWRITASVGPYLSGLIDEQYSLAEDSVQVAGSGTSTHYKRRKRIVRENGAELYSYTGVTVLTHFEHRSCGNVSWAGSLGAGAQSDGLRILVGGSLLLGDTQRCVLTGGVALGRVTRLSSVYSSDPNDPASKVDPSISVVPTRQINAARPFIAITYNLNSTTK